MMEQKEPNYKQMILCLVIIVVGCIWNFYPMNIDDGAGDKGGDADL